MTQADAHFAGWLPRSLAESKPDITQKIPMITRGVNNGGSGVKNSEYCMCSLNNWNANRNSLILIICKQRDSSLPPQKLEYRLQVGREHNGRSAAFQQ